MSQLITVVQSLSFSEQRVLWLFVVGLPLVVLVARTRLRATPAGLRTGVLAMRVTVVGLLVLALAEPTLRPVGHGRAVVFAIDVSDSLSADQQQWARAWVDRAVQTLPPGSLTNTIEFGEHAQLAGSELPQGGSTDLEAALRLAGALLPRDPAMAPEVVLLTDGWHTAAGSPADALPIGVAVSYVNLPPPASGARPLAVVHAIDAPGMARTGDQVDVSLDLQAAQAVDGQLRLWLDRSVVTASPIHLEAGESRMVLPVHPGAEGFTEIRAELQVGDLTSTLSTVVVVKPAGRVLVLEDDANQADALVALLKQAGLQVDLEPASKLPPAASSLSDYDGAVLVNTPATSLTLDQQRTLQSFVQDLGRGLLVVGGPRAFSPGGYQGTVLDDLLPVSADPPIEPQQGSLALFLVIDRSGSMDMFSGGSAASGGASKLAMAREAAAQAAGLLQPQDTLGVIAFDSSFQWVVPTTKLSGPDDVKRVQDQIATIRPGGGTSILPPLQAAFEAAARVDAPLRHVVLLTDGESNDVGYEDLIARMKPAQITLSTLAIGSDADVHLLANLAHLGGGRYYFTERSTQIPRIASKETTILTRNAVVEGQIAAVVADPSPILRSLSGDLPALSGYVATTRKDRAVTALETQRGHPLLAHWQYGLGRVVAWTSEAQQGWASAWAQWPAAARFWSQAVRWSLPAPVRADFQPTVQVGPDGRQVTLKVQAAGNDGHFADLQDTRATVVGPDGVARQVSLAQLGPGTYGLDSRVSLPGIYRVEFDQGSRQEVAGFSTPDAIEAHSVGVNTALLDLLATTSGGHALGDVADLGSKGNGAGPTFELWPWLLGLAVVLLPLDVFVRRRA